MWMYFTINATIFVIKNPFVKKVSVTFSYSVRPEVLICFVVIYFND